MIKRFYDGRDWFFKKRFGLFVHWGLYAIPAWHEQIQWRKNIPREEYGKLAQQFNPVNFDPEEWLDLAEAAGMEYICFTTKHHDGFCMWDTKQTNFNIMNTSYKKDIVGMLAKACQKRNFPLCLYYSIADWHHPNYPNQGRTHEIPHQPQDSPHMPKYMEYLKAQIRELCSNYGEIHGIWWDMNVPNYLDPSVHQLIRKLQPKAVINDRGFETGVMFDILNGDFTTPERGLPDGKYFKVPTEGCQSLGCLSWGYKKDEDFYSNKYLIQNIDKCLSMGGNYLLNIGPQPDGTIQDESVNILNKIGKWYKKVGESFYGNPASELTENPEVFITRKNNSIYVHLNPDPICNSVKMNPIKTMPKKAILLNNSRKLECVIDSDTQHHNHAVETLRIRNLPVNELSNEVMVIKLEFDKGVF